MSLVVPESKLPVSLSTPEAVEAAYAAELAEVTASIARGLPSLIECEKELAPFLFMQVRSRLKDRNLRCIYLDGRPREGEQAGPVPLGMMGTMIAQLREAVRGSVERRVVVLPHLDLLTTSSGGLTGEAREVIPLLYENPELVWLGFKDPSFPLPKVIENLFPHRVSILGTSRNRLANLVTQREARKFGKQFNPWQLYKFVSGVNAVRLRKLLSTLEGEDYPAEPKLAYRHLRQATLTGTLEIPDIHLENDIGGYTKVKKRLREEILDVLQKRDAAENPDDVARLEELIPRGMIFWGPPGTGKTYFAKAIATAIGAAITIVSGPELKSKWVGESEENLRQIFQKPARVRRRSSSSTNSTASPPRGAPTRGPASSTRWSTSCSPRWTASTKTSWCSWSARPTSSSRSTPRCCAPAASSSTCTSRIPTTTTAGRFSTFTTPRCACR